jgi:hypothetical protein
MKSCKNMMILRKSIALRNSTIYLKDALFCVIIMEDIIVVIRIPDND